MRNNEKNKFMWRAAKLCSTLLFALFSFLYLYCMQSDLLACFQYILSDGLTSYSPLVGGLVITFLLVFLGELLAYVWALPMQFVALSYFPSALCLLFLTMWTPLPGGLVAPLHSWVWIGVILFLGSGCVYLLKKYASFIVKDKYSFTDIWSNLVFLLLLFLAVGGLGNTCDTLHRQLRAERLLDEERFDVLADLRTYSRVESHTYSAIRALALANEHRLGEELFRMPQCEGAKELLVSERDFLSHDSLDYKFYGFWGARPGKHVQEKPDLFFKMILDRHLCDSLHRSDVADYYLSSLLLDRKLDQFAAEVENYYPLNDSLPRHYQEALILYKRIRTAPVCVYQNESLEENYNDYLQISREKSAPVVIQNKLRKAFGASYWFYYYKQ